MNASHGLDDVPAHRVVNRNGFLTGKNHFETSNQMQHLLEREGLKIIHDKVVEFEKHFWNPSLELEFP